MTLRGTFAVLCTLALGAPVQAEGLCPAFNSFVADVAAWQADAAHPVLDIAVMADRTRDCGMAMMMSGVRSGHCAWAYPFRAPEGIVAFEQVLASVAQCGTPEVPKKAQAGVNHPDSYDQRMYRIGDAVISVSLKDKGALGETYVFVRADVRP